MANSPLRSAARAAKMLARLTQAASRTRRKESLSPVLLEIGLAVLVSV
jgi:hypothetical protein